MILPTHELVILTKFHKDWPKSVKLLVIYQFCASSDFFHQSLDYPFLFPVDVGYITTHIPEEVEEIDGYVQGCAPPSQSLGCQSMGSLGMVILVAELSSNTIFDRRDLIRTGATGAWHP